MEVIQNRYGQDRVIEKLSSNKIRITGESLFIRKSEGDNNKLTMFDFEGGPCLNVGGKIKYLNSEWTITEILSDYTTKDNLISVTLSVDLNG